MKRTFTVEYGVVWLDESCRHPWATSAVFRWEGDDAKVLDPRTAAVLALGERILAIAKISRDGKRAEFLASAVADCILDGDGEIRAALAADAEAGQ